MAYVCYKGHGACVTCPHNRYDEERRQKICYAEQDKTPDIDHEKKEVR